MSLNLEKLVITAVLAACGPKNGEPTTEVTGTRNQIYTKVVNNVEEISRFSGIRNTYAKLKKLSEEKHAGASANLPDVLSFKTAHGTLVTVKIVSNGRQLMIENNYDILFLDLGTQTPFEGDCIQLNDSRYCKTDDPSIDGTISRGLEAAFKYNSGTKNVFAAFGVTPKAFPEDRAQKIMTELLKHL